MKKYLFSIAVLLSAATFAFGQQLQQLPNDPATRVGKLDNGLTYYIRHNENPSNRAEFYLATHVGALQEAPDQDGLAHFLEHMCFNGTKNFPEKSLLNWLESIGASFGGNINAGTGVEQTIYMLNNIPLIRPTVVDSCLLIMHDYSHFVTCDPAEIDAERGVILEEKRTRNTAQWRMNIASKPYLYADTKYATTSLIGSEENLKNFKPESLTNFYHTWYRPDMQALIVVGDVNVDEVEAKILEAWSDIPAAENPKAKDVIKIPVNDEPAIGILTDPENTSTSFELYWKDEATPIEYNSTAIGEMIDLCKNLIETVMNERLSELVAKPDCPFIASGFGFTSLCETDESTVAQVVPKEGLALEALEAMLTAVETASRYGFTDSEIERAKTEVLSQYEALANKADTRKNSEFVYPYIYNFFQNKPFMDPATELEIVKAILPQISAEVLNQMVLPGDGVATGNLSVLYIAPEREGLVHPTEEQVKAVLAKVHASEIDRPAGEEVPEAFLDPATLKGAKVKSTREGLYGSTELVLGNGVKVVLLPKDIEKDRIQFNILKKGGRTLIEDEDIFSFDENIWTLYINNSGIGQFPNTLVGKMLSGKQVSASPYISESTHGVSGSSTRKDIETAFQMMYLYFTDPRFDADEYNMGINRIKTILPNLMSTSDYAISDQLYKTIYDSPRRVFLNDEVMEKASLETLEKVYRSMFADAAGATVVVAGDFELEPMTALVAKYFGSLPAGKKAGSWIERNDGIRFASAVSDFTAKMQAPKVTVVQVYSYDAPYTAEAKVAYAGLEYILDIVYTATLREEEGGTYGASTSAVVSNEPLAQRYLQVAFDTNEQQADALRALAVKGLRDLAENGPSAENYDKAVKYLEKILPENHIKLAYWVNALNNNAVYEYDYDAEYAAALKSITPEKIQAAAAELVNSGNFMEVIMRPEK
ncbi:MAG: insulinase family protein [Bacteroidales bacterium]|nr:insulinase family protein [Bacteroidales bacterium]